MPQQFTISLRDLKFHSRIGVLEQERKVGNDFIVDLDVVFDASGFRMEDLGTSVSYADLYDEVKAVMGTEWLLLESVTRTIGDNIRKRWPMIEKINIAIIKTMAPIPGLEGNCRVEFSWRK